jgi:hypothetical protein
MQMNPCGGATDLPLYNEARHLNAADVLILPPGRDDYIYIVTA